MRAVRPRVRVAVAAMAVAALGALSACGEQGGSAAKAGADYPKKPVTLTAPADPGSGWDTTARAFADVVQKEHLSKVALPVQNRPGATGAVWLSTMVNQYKGDPYQIAVTSLPIMSNNLRGDSKYSYKDVTMIARMITEYYIVVVPADSPYKDLDGLVAAIKADAKGVPVGAAGDDRLPFALIVKDGGADPRTINFVAYEGGGDEITALLNGDVKAAVAGVSEFRGQIEAGKLRALAVLKDERLAAPLDDIPTAKEQGYDVTLENWRGMYGPPGMPEQAVSYWQDVIEKALKTDTWKKIAQRNQWDTTFMKGAEFARYLDQTNAAVKAGLQEVGEIK